MKLIIKERQIDGREVSAEFELHMIGGNLLVTPENYPKGTSVAQFRGDRKKLQDLLFRLEMAGNADGTMRVWIQE